MPQQIHITAFYHFTPVAENHLQELHDALTHFGESRSMRGLVLIAPEGINGTVCGSAHSIEEWKQHIISLFPGVTFKDSFADRFVFRRWSVKIKPEIVGLKKPEIVPQGKHRHLTPDEWNDMLADDDVLILDARNDYEVKIGKFHGAINPGIRRFREFPSYIQHANLPKDKKILMYCTGGIRCEKALLTMEEEGYDNVYQLDGGILAYLQKFPNTAFEGECLVFDQRTAVDQELKPSTTYGICPHCGLPGKTRISCTRCQADALICETCNRFQEKRSCSKNCANKICELV